MAEDRIQHRKRVSHRSYVLDTNAGGDMRNYLYPVFNNDNEPQQQRMAYARKRPDSLICSICSGPAHGYNFDAITCESCKAFFRRNALKSNGELKCRLNNGRCVITVSTRKRCKACRLAKCLEQGMRADWILTDEERLNKRKKIEENRRLRQMLYPDSPETDETQIIKTKAESYDNDDDDDDDDDYDYEDHDNDIITLSFITPVRSLLSSEDLIRIQKIQQAYDDSVRLISLPPDIPSYPQSVRITQISDMINFPTNILATRLITYFKLLPEFSSLNEYDKLILIKYNTFPLVFIRSALNYDPLTDNYHEPNTDDCVFSGRDLIQCFSLHQYEQSTHCVRNLVNASLNDRFLLEVLLIIMLFSKGSSICAFADEVEPIAQDILTIYKTQNVFIGLLWKYCENKFGSFTTTKIWLKLTVLSMDAHLQAYKIRHDYVKADSITDQISPLMKSVMLII
ncbi:unnamed protein product [Rotaria sp. Silwood2]|nr:unnamed protein product [Rotaria sp. Silwood2]CAF2509224.1 unnamed protein product [Rotaria sp. Silwood2]CAF2714452.1 unnamed protein product [Rotaria sp. Silwood2]CAF2881729.1 unnamed protein product [Rotaria sp. Silwood2]CAF3925684.1 unnamed protein product [Rotaria sp. Silwood2]